MDKYEFAQFLIRDGRWNADSVNGHVIGTRGKTLGCLDSDGYIVLTLRPNGPTPRIVRAHRVIWESQHGPIPAGVQINHINGVKHDNRIGNLEMATASQNIQHAWRTGLSSQPHGEKSYRAKLSGAQVADIRERASSGETQQSLADEYGVCQAQVSRIVHRKQWAA
jgi:hypothetical protein